MSHEANISSQVNLRKVASFAEKPTKNRPKKIREHIVKSEHDLVQKRLIFRRQTGQ